ncbi:DUF4136 domain-containing protein [Piscinibacter koreensis]|uniref:DUF4136 domain-containing protein n=1 Tax=Piscinibacter koreensis TaxID=2742824 RepID=A0A7Y6NNJ0_9BURK|nr:DUF4136 domain-containing protein [Schlegelella koreensis]NUZ06460.1 DUF4136 domain-containing protein [Schlegelella koreensis]
MTSLSGTRARSVRFVAAGAALALLAGCASLATLNAEVSSYGEWPVGRATPTYAFERLPSQQSDPTAQERLEAAARPALERAGFTSAADPARADVRVQIGARITAVERSPFDDPFWVGRFGRPWAFRHRPLGWGPGWYGSSPPRYEREVALLMRDGTSSTPLYEARATNDGFGGALERILPALFAAALADFPKAVPDPHVVSVPLAP